MNLDGLFSLLLSSGRGRVCLGAPSKVCQVDSKCEFYEGKIFKTLLWVSNSFIFCVVESLDNISHVTGKAFHVTDF